MENNTKTVEPLNLEELIEYTFNILPITKKLYTGQLTFPEGQTESDLHRLIGGFFAGNPAVIGASQSLKQLEYNPEAQEAA